MPVNLQCLPPMPTNRMVSCPSISTLESLPNFTVPQISESSSKNACLAPSGDARQPTGARSVARRRAERKRSDRVLGGSVGVRRHTAGCASVDAGVFLHQAYRAIYIYIYIKNRKSYEIFLEIEI